MAARVLLNCTLTRLEDMLAKGNIWYVEHYRHYFDRYICGFLIGQHRQPIERNGIELVPLGSGRKALDVLLTPWRVYALWRRVRPTHVMTADLVLAWWHFSLLRILTGVRPIVMPVYNPEEIHAITGRTVSHLPLAIERTLVRLSLGIASRVLCVHTDPGGIAWVRSTGFGAKLKIVGVLPEEFSAPEFLESLEMSGEVPRASPVARLVYIGRLEKEKLVDDLIDAIEHLHADGRRFHLTVLGDGTERAHLEARVAAAGLQRAVTFTGFLQAADVARHLRGSDICVSPYTGTALREAALAGLAIVAYRLGGIEDIFRNGETCLLAEPGDTRGLAVRLTELIDCEDRRLELARAAKALAERTWSIPALTVSLREAFD